MSRLAILADIHGNLPALNTVIDDMAQFAVDQVVVAGDSINWGPFSLRVLEVICERRWPAVRGNNEFYLLDYDTERAPAHWSRFTMPPYLHELLGDDWVNFIAAHARYPAAALSRCAADTGLPRHTGRSLDRHHATIISGASPALAARYKRAHGHRRAQPYRAERMSAVGTSSTRARWACLSTANTAPAT